MRLQTELNGQLVYLRPLKEEDFESLFKCANDPLIWEQHPNPDRYKREVFRNYFRGAIESCGAFVVYKKDTNEMIGCTRYYDLNEKERSILIGYTFLVREVWGKGYNAEMKRLMLHHAFQSLEKVIFHVGDKNIRSQKAMEKIGANKVGVINIAYYGEKNTGNVVYEVERSNFNC